MNQTHVDASMRTETFSAWLWLHVYGQWDEFDR